MPGFSFSRKHKENKKWDEGSFEEQCVSRTDTAQNQVADNSRVALRFVLQGSLTDRWRGIARDAAFDTADFHFKGYGRLPPGATVFRPIFREIRHTRPHAVANRADYAAEQQNHDHRADGARYTP